MDNEYGIKVALSPVQMAAVLSDKSISEGETLSNRLFGGLGLAGGVVEMFGAGAMCIVPEPTMTLHRTFHQSTGILVKRGSQEVFKCHGVRVVLDFQPWNGKPYFILTAFPEI
ncbi:hypothetical protein JOJ88_005882 [Pantoea cypripedii]|nr:RNase A-like domain-containing protein [Pantoea cypripedii]MBP2200341.1 hypothetical protein [Pantoea cypripedii]